jgi:hypothetical protein
MSSSATGEQLRLSFQGAAQSLTGSPRTAARFAETLRRDRGWDATVPSPQQSVELGEKAPST